MDTTNKPDETYRKELSELWQKKKSRKMLSIELREYRQNKEETLHYDLTALPIKCRSPFRLSHQILLA